MPTIVQGGTWIVTYPASCDLTCDITYLPAHVDAAGTGKAVEAEVIDRLTAAVAGDPWFAEHPLRFTWSDDVVPAEMPADHPLVTTALGCARDVGLGTYVKAWKICLTLEPNTWIGRGVSGWGETAGEALEKLRAGSADRVRTTGDSVRSVRTSRRPRW